MPFIAPTHRKAAVAYPPITNGLVFWAELEEGSGTTVSDSSGNGIDGAFDTGTPAWVQGWKAGRFGLQYNGANNVRFYNNEEVHTALQQLGNNNNYTVAGWFKTTSHSGGNNFWRPNGVIADLRRITTNSGSYRTPFAFGINAGKLWLGRAGGAAYNGGAQGLTTVNDGNWHHGAVRITDAYAELFIDGAADGDYTYGSGADGLCHVGITSSSFCFGAGIRNGNQADTEMFIGSQDDFRVYDRLLTDQEIADIAAGNG